MGIGEDKFALITGTSSGIGHEMARFLLDEGFTVIGISRRGTALDHSRFIDILCDIRDEAAIEEMFELVENHTDKLDLIVLNAGVYQMSPLVETSHKEFIDQLETNVVGAFHVLKHAVEFLVEDETHIITISSTAAKKGWANIAGYCASKFALNGMIESLREEWSHLGVRFSTLMPGAIATPIWSQEDLESLSDQMLTIEEFMHVFQMIVASPKSIQFPEIHFMHKHNNKSGLE